MRLLILCLSLCSLAATIHGYALKNQLYVEKQLFLTQLGDLFQGLQEEQVLTAVINDYVDIFLANANNLISANGYDPLNVTAVSKESWWGSINLAEIQVEGLSTLSRPTDSEITYNNSTKQLKISLPFGFDGLVISATYDASLFGIGPSGTVKGTVTGVEITTVVNLDIALGGATIESFDFSKEGSISIAFGGHAWTDWMLNYVVNAVSSVFDGIIENTVNSVVKVALQTLVDIVNNILSEMLNPETTTQLIS